MSIHKRNIRLADVDLTVFFTFERGHEATEFDPGSSDWLQIEHVVVDDIDIFHIIGDKTLERIEQEIWSIYNDGDKLDY